MDNFELIVLENGLIVWRSGVKSTPCGTYVAGQMIDLRPLGPGCYTIDAVAHEISNAEAPTLSEGLLFRTVLMVNPATLAADRPLAPWPWSIPEAPAA